MTIKPQSDDENDNVLNAASHIMTTIHTKFVGPDFDLYDNNGKKKNTSRWSNAVEFKKQYQLYYKGGHGKDKEQKIQNGMAHLPSKYNNFCPNNQV